jgi:GTP-binding protein YchF
LAKSGKTTVFNALTGGKAQTSAFAGGKVEPNVAVVKVPDARVDKLAEIYQPKKTTYATVKYVDVAGLAREDDSPERGVPEALLQYVGRADALIAVIRGFEDPLHGAPKIAHEAETVHLELIFSDLAKVENRLQKLEKSLPKLSGREREIQQFEYEVLRKLHPLLQDNKPVRAAGLSLEEEKAIRGFQFLTAKPIMYLLNVDEKDLPKGDELVAQLNISGITDQPKTATAWLAGELEMEIAQLEGEDRAAFLRDYNIETPAAHRIIALSYKLLGYISFFTVGPDEVRAWTIPAGALAPQAAGTIHSDFERGFIRAEVVAYEELIRQGSFANAKKHGLCRLEGKSYEVQDGDVINFLFSV